MHPVGCKDWDIDLYVFSKQLIIYYFAVFDSRGQMQEI